MNSKELVKRITDELNERIRRYEIIGRSPEGLDSHLAFAKMTEAQEIRNFVLLEAESESQ